MVTIKLEDSMVSFEKLVTKCPAYGSSDESYGKISFQPGDVSAVFIKRLLEECLNSIEGEKIWMEVIPIRILDYCVKRCIEEQRYGKMEAAPKSVAMDITFDLKGKSVKDKFRTIKISFQRIDK